MTTSEKAHTYNTEPDALKEAKESKIEKHEGIKLDSMGIKTLKKKAIK